MNAATIKPIRVKRMLKKVAFTENLISTSFVRVSFFWQHFLVLDSNVKKENVGNRKREGCLRKVLKRVRCQVKVTPVIRPGRVSRGTGKGKIRADIQNLTNIVNRQARKMMMNRMERKPLRSPPSENTLHTPTLGIIYVIRI